jgi:hypothetical protein
MKAEVPGTSFGFSILNVFVLCKNAKVPGLRFQIKPRDIEEDKNEE